jgi:hypothetical protein
MCLSKKLSKWGSDREDSFVGGNFSGKVCWIDGVWFVVFVLLVLIIIFFVFRTMAFCMTKDLYQIFRKAQRSQKVELAWTLRLRDTYFFEIERTFIGKERSVRVSGERTAVCHTHVWSPGFHSPPSDHDLACSIYNYFRGEQINMVLDDFGLWVFEPNQGLIDSIIESDPDIREKIGTLEENKQQFIVSNDTAQAVQLAGRRVKIQNVKLSQKPEDLNLIREVYQGQIPLEYSPITMAQYIENVHNLLAPGIGFHFQFFEDEPGRDWEAFLIFSLNQSLL